MIRDAMNETSHQAAGLAVCRAAVLSGIDAGIVDVEAGIGSQLPGLTLVGLPSVSVKESEERVRSAVIHSGFPWPKRHITVNLAPADLRKEGSSLDLPIALAILGASGVLPPHALGGRMALGELALDGRVRPIRGALNYAILCRDRKIRELIVPVENAAEAALCDAITVRPIEDLRGFLRILSGENRPIPLAPPQPAGEWELDFAEVRGLETPRRGALIAAAGGHNLLMIGPPGSGKTMIARRLPTILPDLSFDEAIEMLRIHSAAGLTLDGRLETTPPFRAPHHTVSLAGLIGGGAPIRPGEISLAHRGILFLDELAEFRRDLLESLRQPLEDGFVHITRARATARFPARFLFIAAMNPCPCGYLGSHQPCTCSTLQVAHYRRRISGPLMDRIDLHIEVPRRPYAETSLGPDGESSAVLRDRILSARERQKARYGRALYRTNAAATPRVFRQKVAISVSARALVGEAVDGLGLSARAAERILRVARTIADLADREEITDADVAEAIGFRTLDRRSAP